MTAVERITERSMGATQQQPPAAPVVRVRRIGGDPFKNTLADTYMRRAQVTDDHVLEAAKAEGLDVARDELACTYREPDARMVTGNRWNIEREGRPIFWAQAYRDGTILVSAFLDGEAKAGNRYTVCYRTMERQYVPHQEGIYADEESGEPSSYLDVYSIDEAP